MKKASKILSLVLILALFALMAMGSGSSDTDEVKTPSSVTSGGESAESTGSDSTSSPAQPAADVTIEEAVIYEQDGVKITAKSFQSKGSFGPELKLLIENDGDRSVTVQVRELSVNGYMVDSMMSAEVAPGKKANDELTLTKSSLELAGITTIADLEFRFHIFDSDTWETINDSELIRIETSAAAGFTYTYNDEGHVVYDENGLKIVVKGISEGDSWLGPSVVVYLYNAGSQDVSVQVRDVSINGFMVESIFSCDVPMGKHAIDTITFLSSDLEENSIETIESIELSFHVFDMNTWHDIVDTPPITISFD